MAVSKPVKNKVLPPETLLSRLSSYFFKRSRTVALLWLVLVVFGIFSYTTLLKREGFPNVAIPMAVVNGAYFANDPAAVDKQVAQPISELALKQDGASSVRTQSTDNFFTVEIQYEEQVDAKAAAKQLEAAVKADKDIPKDVALTYNVPYFGATGGDIQKIDVAISFYDPEDKTDLPELTAKATAAAAWLNERKIPLVESAFVKSPFENVTDPATGQTTSIQRSFDTYGKRTNGQITFRRSVIIGIAAVNKADVIKIDENVRRALEELERQPAFSGLEAEVSASFAPSIEDTLSELQRVLLEGLLAVLIVGSIVIAVRASLITVLSMVTVLAMTIGLLYLIGYTLNVITLFALILGLSLIVDDTIIMVEAIDAARRRQKDGAKAVSEAIRKISRAMVAATLTAALSFAPLIFVGGVLGNFIRAIPITIISALLISLFVALVFIPLFARYLLLGRKQMGEGGVKEISANIEAAIARGIARPMIWARNSRRKLFAVGTVAVLTGLAFVLAGGFLASKVVFNIFPPSKDTNGLILTFAYPANTSIDQAQAIAGRADKLVADILDENFVQASYYNTGNAQSGMMQVQIIPYTERDVTAPQLARQLQGAFDKNFKDARVAVGQADVGPPAGAFAVQIVTEDREAGYRLAGDVAAFLRDEELVRPSGKTARLKNVNVSSQDEYLRSDGKSVIRVSAGFDGTDTTTLVTLAQNAVKERFNEQTMRSYGFGSNVLQFDIGQESENQDSFKTLALAFPILMFAIYVLLAFEFRSLLQPLLIFMAIPFSIFGVMLGLYLTDNAISFFALLGFFALIGLSLKNTILLTDYANQAHRLGLGAVDSAVAALAERFRPLVATSLTAVVSLIPLALTSPFWEGLAVVLIFGLLSSTLLVILVFPYYYLGGEFLKRHISRTSFFIWVIAVGLTGFIAIRAFGGAGAWAMLLAALIAPLILRRLQSAIAK